MKDVATKLYFQPKSSELDRLTIQRLHSENTEDSEKTTKKKERPKEEVANAKRRLPRSHTLVHRCHIPPEAILLLLAIAFAGLVLYSDYQSRVASIEADLNEKQLRCRHNYTVNM